MTRPSRRQTSAQRRERREKNKAIGIVFALFVMLATGLGYYLHLQNSARKLDANLCPVDVASKTVMLIDVTDPLNLPQKQDFNSKFAKAVRSIPKNGQITILKVDAISNELLRPVITRCNPGDGSDVNEFSGNPRKAKERYESQYMAALSTTGKSLTEASNAERSPIFESIQSGNLTEFADFDGPKRLIVVSDLLQNTEGISFYQHPPSADVLRKLPAFDKVRTDLSGVHVELWMLQRDDFRTTQGRTLPELWEELLHDQGATVDRVVNISG